MCVARGRNRADGVTPSSSRTPEEEPGMGKRLDRAVTQCVRGQVWWLAAVVVEVVVEVSVVVR